MEIAFAVLVITMCLCVSVLAVVGTFVIMLEWFK